MLKALGASSISNPPNMLFLHKDIVKGRLLTCSTSVRNELGHVFVGLKQSLVPILAMFQQKALTPPCLLPNFMEGVRPRLRESLCVLRSCGGQS